MARKFSEPRAKMSTKARSCSAKRAQTMVALMPLQELRHAKELSQAKLRDRTTCQSRSHLETRAAHRHVHQHAAWLHRGDGRRAGYRGEVSGRRAESSTYSAPKGPRATNVRVFRRR